MVYKKYIRKNGKLYGPYIYQSKRVNGKVVSEYIGMGNEKRISFISKKTISIFLLLMVLLISIFFINFNLTGNVTFDLNSRIDENLELSLLEGELIPLNSKIKIYSNLEESEYFLKDLIDLEEKEGRYYFEGKDLKDSGEGIGIEGKKEEYPAVYFKFQIIEIENESDLEDESNNENLSSEESIEEINETSSNSENLTIEENFLEEDLEETNDQENLEEKFTEEESNQIEITGSIITGKIISEEPIQADVSYDSEFSYKLKEGQTIKIIEESIKTEEKNLNESILIIEISGNTASIKTNYKEEFSGFGKDFIGKETKIPIDKNKINISKENITRIELILEELIEDDSEPQEPLPIDENESFSEEESVPIELEENITIENNSQMNETELNISNESIILIQNLGTSNITTSKVNYRDKIIVKMKISNYEREFSYSGNLAEEELEEKIRLDKQKFIEDLETKFTEEKFVEQIIN